MASVDVIRGDRRTDRRYAFEMPMRFLYRSAGSLCLGYGQTVDLSRKGIRFASDDPPPMEVEVELHIEWPFLLQHVCPLELRVWGQVLRNDSAGTVVRTSKYEFRTVGERSFDQVIARAAGLSIVA